MGMKVALDFDRVEGNAYALLGAFRKAARRQGYPQADIGRVIDDARCGAEARNDFNRSFWRGL